MSNILDNAILRPNEITKSKHKEPKTSSILLITLAITMAIILLMYAGMWVLRKHNEAIFCM